MGLGERLVPNLVLYNPGLTYLLHDFGRDVVPDVVDLEDEDVIGSGPGREQDAPGGANATPVPTGPEARGSSVRPRVSLGPVVPVVVAWVSPMVPPGGGVGRQDWVHGGNLREQMSNQIIIKLTFSNKN